MTVDLDLWPHELLSRAELKNCRSRAWPRVAHMARTAASTWEWAARKTGTAKPQVAPVDDPVHNPVGILGTQYLAFAAQPAAVVRLAKIAGQLQQRTS
jgi:hypothetical protein